jgi:hypothetical protein
MALTNEQKHACLEAIKQTGTVKAGALAAGVDPKTIRSEAKRSLMFRRRLEQAKLEGKANIVDNARQLIIDYAMGKVAKTDRNVLTAATILCNAYEPGFRGTSHVEGKVEHNMVVTTAIPRPNYDLIDAPRIIESGEQPRLPAPKRNRK